MEHKMMVTHILGLNKKSFDDSFNAVVTVGKHAETMVRTFLNSGLVLPEEGRKAFADWVSVYKNGLEAYKANADRRFELIKEYISKTADWMDTQRHSAGPLPADAELAFGASGKKKSMDVQASADKKTKTKRKRIKRQSITNNQKKN